MKDSTDLLPFLKRVPLFADLNDAALALFARVCRVRKISKSATLFNQDDEGELEREPKLLRQLLGLIAERLRASSERERALAFLDAPARLARMLLQLDRASSKEG